MRTMLKGGLALLLIVVGLATYGLLTPTITHTFDVTVNRPIIPVFAKLVSVNDMPQWVRGLETVEARGFNIIPGFPMGSYDLHYGSATVRDYFQMDILNIDPLQSAKVRLSNDMMEIECMAVFTAQGDSTVMSLQAVAKGKGLVARMALPYVKWRLRSETEENVARFKEIIESN
ncbi:MAG: hypothetical protein K9J06_09045 [Flavobacteriales bacterium]|nr:hypothetical protein [Flavobacteriales bacterium]